MDKLAHRKAAARLRILGADGAPVANRPVEIRQTAHRFLFGCGAFDALALQTVKTDADRAFLSERLEKWLGLFNYGTLPFYWGRYEPVPDYSGHIRLHFIATGTPAYAGSAYSVECVYDAYTESWVENDTEFTYLILNPLLSCTGVSPFEEVYGDANVALHREKGPNMRVVRCKEFVSLRETRSTTAKRLAKVPLGALVLAYPEYGEANGFLYCVYHDEEGYILAEYLQPLE